ncbi:MAG: cation transporter dimerization domain-containing protein, partial [Bilophila wadsworthia]
LMNFTILGFSNLKFLKLDLSLAAAHDVATDMERRLRTCAPKLDRILIHTDPSALIVMPEER